MKTSLWRTVAVLGLGMTIITGPTVSGSQPSAPDRRDGERFVGAWRLVSLEERDPSGTVHKADCTGQFVFTADGHASVQVMYHDAAGGTGSPQYARGGYEATFGRYDVDEATQTFTFHVEGAVVRSLVGRDLNRRYTLTGNQLDVQPVGPDEHWRVVWQRD